MKQAAKTYFKSLLAKKDILVHESGLGDKLLNLEEFDLWTVLSEFRNQLGKPIIVFEVGASQVLHFHVPTEDHDIYVEVIPKDRNTFFNLLGDYINYVDH
jgi:hypothetical protein